MEVKLLTNGMPRAQRQLAAIRSVTAALLNATRQRIGNGRMAISRSRDRIQRLRERCEIRFKMNPPVVPAGTELPSPPRVYEPHTEQRCLQCPADAQTFALYRGLCSRCYRQRQREVQQGKTTWAKLERKGLALPTHRGGRPLGRWFTIFRKLLAE